MLALFGLIRCRDSFEKEPPRMINFRQLPISELHNHVEGGTLTPGLVERFAKRNEMPLKPDLFDDNGIPNFKPGDFHDFLRVYDEISNYVVTHEDVSDLVYDYLRRCHAQGAIYVELGCSPDHLKKNRITFEQTSAMISDLDLKMSGLHLHAHHKIKSSSTIRRGLNYKEFVHAVAEGIDRARADFGIEARMVMILLRHNADIHGALEADLHAIIHNPHPYVVGLGLAGDENRYGPERFAHLYRQAKEAGLKLTAHAGEFADAHSMRQAISDLQLDRVGHGVNCHTDPTLISWLAERGIGLEICPTSNFELKVFSRENHPFLKLFKEGVRLSISSDDPSFFGTTLGHEWKLLSDLWGLTHQDRIKVARDSIQMSFAGDKLKAMLLAKVDLYAAFHRLKDVLPSPNILDEYEKSPEYATLASLSKKIRHSYTEPTMLELCDKLEQAHTRLIDTTDTYQLSIHDWFENDGATKPKTELVI